MAPALISKWFLYYPITLLKGELHFRHISNYKSYESMPLKKIRSLQKEQFIRIVSHAKKHSAFYQSHYKNVDINELRQKSLQEALLSVPTISKKDLIEHGNDMRAMSNLFTTLKTTGGSTGQPVTLLKNADALARERVATNLAYEWAGVQLGEKQARFWGEPITASGHRKALMADIAANRYRISAFDLTEEALEKYCQNLTRYKPDYFYGYVSAIKELCRYISEIKHFSFPSLKAIITTSEVLTEADANFISRVLSVPVFNEYGCGEVGSIAHQCKSGNMHLMSHNQIVEVDNGTNQTLVGLGPLLVTDLHNLATPIIRYGIGDFGELSTSSCSCGNQLPLLSGIYGRAYDMLITPEGKKIHPEAVIYIFEQLQERYKAFKQFQVIQTAKDKLELKIVANENYDENIDAKLRAGIAQVISGSLLVGITKVEAIEREPSGKLRLVKNLLN